VEGERRACVWVRCMCGVWSQYLGTMDVLRVCRVFTCDARMKGESRAYVWVRCMCGVFAEFVGTMHGWRVCAGCLRVMHGLRV
jgi:hypothetical protein